MTASVATNQFGNITYWTNTDPQSLPGESSAQATSIANAFNAVSSQRAVQTWKPADATARGLLTGMTAGDLAYQLDTGIIYKYSGSAWIAWQSEYANYTPSSTSGWTAGTGGSSSFIWKYINGEVQIELILTVGTSPTIGTPTFQLPTSINSSYPQYSFLGTGHASSNNAGANVSPVTVLRNVATSQMSIFATNVASTYPALAGMSTTAPVTFVSGGYIMARLSYRPA